MGDLERLTNRWRSASPRRVISSISRLGCTPSKSWSAGVPAVQEASRISSPAFSALPELRELIERALVHEPPLTLAEGGVDPRGLLRRIGYAARRRAQRPPVGGGSGARERERTGIANLKVGYNKVFGYYLEVTNSQLAACPPTISASRR